jgi:hypothetical protein
VLLSLLLIFYFGLDLGLHYSVLVLVPSDLLFHCGFCVLSPGAIVHLALPLGFFIPLWRRVTEHVFLRAGEHRVGFFSDVCFILRLCCKSPSALRAAISRFLRSSPDFVYWLRVCACFDPTAGILISFLLR